MRVFTVPDARRTRLSILYATGLIGFFQLTVLIVGFGGMVLVGPDLVAAAGDGGNMAAPLLARTLGGGAFFGFICAVSFATMLAVVAALTLTGAASISHDVWDSVIRVGSAGERETMRVARLASIALAVVAVLLGLLFHGENVAFMAGLAHAVACSANLPALLLSIYWRRMTTAGAVAAIFTGAVSAMLMIVLSPTIQVDILGRAPSDLAQVWWFVPLRNPAIVSMPLSFAAAVVVSLLTGNERDRAGFAEMRTRTVFGGRVAALADLAMSSKTLNG